MGGGAFLHCELYPGGQFWILDLIYKLPPPPHTHTHTHNKRLAPQVKFKYSYGSCTPYSRFIELYNLYLKFALLLFVLPTDKPGKPKINFTEVQASYIRVKWTPPVYDGGSPVIDYRVIVDGAPGKNRPPVTGTETLIEQLMPGKSYSVILSARNVVGYGESETFPFTTKPEGTCNVISELIACLWDDITYTCIWMTNKVGLEMQISCMLSVYSAKWFTHLIIFDTTYGNRSFQDFRRHFGGGATAAKITANVREIVQLSNLVTPLLYNGVWQKSCLLIGIDKDIVSSRQKE